METVPYYQEITTVVWEEVGEHDPKARLLGHITILGLDMHLEAIEVEVEEGQQVAVDVDYDDSLRLYHQAASADGHWHTVMIDGREYVLFATPYC